ncbi:Do family serine endopeptidase [Acuticoccus sp. I52.16.1]|uniref:Do family serine endopeptidase n=1 Tax=Acuticoccus sp. I52.16.1 TaxID=2928472 RepID=UPI001FCF8A82|nr:Do family serine endopeptidase [Acuticoccus sp. I52.16.1]UOM34252.1 Do family serine endopeptidase [Acuticoccus sp. I52.16.1]
MGLNIATGKRRTAALLAGTFLMGAAGAAVMDGAGTTPALAQNLSEQVPSAVQNNAPSFADIVDRVSPAVVSIQVKSRANPRLSNFRGFEGSPFDFFEQFEERFGRGDRDNDRRFGQRPDRRGGRQFSMGQGSGFLISADGYVVTNGHVVDDAEEVTVILNDGETHEAEVIGVDEKTDLALVKIEGKHDFPFVSFATQETRVGDWVMAVGNPFGLGGSVTAGIVSARGREIGAGPYDDFLQIDAPINRGNSGGPTFNLAGNVVGVNTAIYSPSGGSVGIGFAIPASIVEDVIADLRDDGNVTRGWLGVQIQTITPELAESIGRNSVAGALVTEPQDGSPAMTAGIEPGDAIVAVDGETVDSPRGLARTISAKEPGSTVAITVWRDGKEQKVDVVLGTLGDTETADRDRGDDRGQGNDQQETSELLGMTLVPARQTGLDSDGLAVISVEPGSAAAEAGIRSGDIILQASGEDVADQSDFESGMDMARSEGRSNVFLRIQSGQNARYVAVPVDEERG